MRRRTGRNPAVSGRQVCSTNKIVIVALVVLACLAGPAAQAPQSDEAAWRAFMAWFKGAPPVRTNPFAAYAASLAAAGTPEADARRQVGALMAMIRERSDWVELYYDKIYTIPLTGDPESDGFATKPSALVVEAVKGLAPGRALDAGMGQGRNAVYLARQGWRVTGFDLSAEALNAARANAAAAGVRLRRTRSSLDRELNDSGRTSASPFCRAVRCCPWTIWTYSAPANPLYRRARGFG